MSPRTYLVVAVLGALASPVLARTAVQPAYAQPCTVNGSPCSTTLTASDYATGFASMNAQGLFPRAVASTTTDALGNFTGSWQRAISGTINVQLTPRTAGVTCTVTNVTSTSVSGSCIGFRPLPGTIVNITALQNYSVTVAATGVQVDIAAAAANDPAGG